MGQTHKSRNLMQIEDLNIPQAWLSLIYQQYNHLKDARAD
jgi:hypothetical protein